MNDRNALFELYKSPGFLLQELGMTNLFLYRPRRSEWKVLPSTLLDAEIWDDGEAMVFHLLPDYRPAIVRFSERDSALRPYRQDLEYALLSIRPNYVGPGQKFFVALREGAADHYDYWPVPVISLLQLLPHTASDLVLPW
jgi:hypothetical protein